MMGHRYFFLILLTLGVIRVDSFAVISSSVPAWRDNQQKSYRFSSLSPWSCSRNGIVLKGSVSDDGDNRKVDKNENSNNTKTFLPQKKASIHKKKDTK